MSNNLHIVFQVLNFLSSDLSESLSLTSDEKLLFLFLAKHKGARGIYPSVQTLARELKRSESAIRRTILKLKKKAIISIDYIPGKSSNYTLHLPENLSTTPSVDARGTTDAPLASTLGHPWRGRQDTPSVNARRIDKKNNTKEITQRGDALSLSNFEPDEGNTLLAQDLRLNVADEVTSFKNRHKGKVTQYEFGRWLKSSFDYNQRRGKAKGGSQDDAPRQSVPDWGKGHPSYDALHGERPKREVKQQPVAEVIEYKPFKQVVKEYVDKHGGLPDGITARDRSGGSSSH